MDHSASDPAPEVTPVPAAVGETAQTWSSPQDTEAKPQPAATASGGGRTKQIVGVVAVVGVIALVAVFGPWGSDDSTPTPVPALSTSAAGGGGSNDDGETEGGIGGTSGDVTATNTESSSEVEQVESTVTETPGASTSPGATEEPESTTEVADPPPTTPAQQPVTAAAEPEQPPAPTEGVIRISGSLPTGSSVRVSGPGAQNRLVGGDSISLAPGRYRLRFAAAGFLPDSIDLDVVAGGVRSWQPLTVREPEPEREVEAVPATPLLDSASVIAGIRQTTEALLGSVAARDVQATLGQFPAASDWVDAGMRALLGSNSVSDVATQLTQFSSTAVAADQASADFGVVLTGRNQNTDLRISYELRGQFSRTGAGWQLSQLEVLSTGGVVESSR